MLPPLQTAAVVTAELISITFVVSISVKERVPVLLRFCAAALAASVKPKSAIAVVIRGASLLPVIITFTVSVAVALLLSVIVTVYKNSMVSPAARNSRLAPLTL